MQAAILQKLDGIENRFNKIENRFNEIENRLNEMDKRFEIRFTKLEESFHRLEDKIAAVNTRIDDKFNLLVGLFGLIAAFLALPYMPKFFNRFKTPPDSKETLQRLQEQIDQLKAQLSQRIGPTL